MKQSFVGLLIFLVVLIVGMKVGSYIMLATFFGTISLIGLIALIESIPTLKWLVSRSTKTIDLIIFVFTILATINYGLTISASLTVAGLGFTLFYGPYVRESRNPKKKKVAPVGNYRSKFNCK